MFFSWGPWNLSSRPGIKPAPTSSEDEDLPNGLPGKSLKVLLSELGSSSLKSYVDLSGLSNLSEP